MMKWGREGYFSFINDSENKVIYLTGNYKMSVGSWYLICLGKNGMDLCRSIGTDVFDTHKSQLKVIGVDLL